MSGLKSIFIAVSLVLVLSTSVQQLDALDLQGAEDVRVPLFDSKDGMCWGTLSFKGVLTEDEMHGPFEVGVLKDLRLSHLMLRFDYWPESMNVNASGERLGAWLSDRPDRLPSFRMECEGEWALLFELIDFPESQHLNSDESSFYVRAQKVTYVESGQIREFKNAKIFYNAQNYEVIIKSPTDGRFHVSLPVK